MCYDTSYASCYFRFPLERGTPPPLTISGSLDIRGKQIQYTGRNKYQPILPPHEGLYQRFVLLEETIEGLEA
jgi:hypothetical protein